MKATGGAGDGRSIRVLIQQPTIPAYRIRLFEALAAQPDLELEIQASTSSQAAPDSTDHDFDFPVHLGESHDLVGGSFLWQTGVRLPSRFSRGDVVIACGNARYLSTLLLVLRARLRGVSVMWWAHARTGGRGLLGRMRRWVMRSWIDVHLLYSERDADLYREIGFREETLCATNNTIDCEPIDEARRAWPDEALADFRRRENPKGRKQLLYCGRLSRSGLDLAMEVLAHLGEQGLDYELVIIGSGDERGSLELAASQLGVQDRVRWLGAIYDQRELAPWFMSASCLVFPGPIGLSLLHAFAFGLGVVTHDDASEHGPEFGALRKGVNGLTFRKGSADDLEAKILEMTSDEESARRFGESARETVENEYSMEAMVGSFAGGIRTASGLRAG